MVELPKLFYFADAMCSWCYGFQPVIDEIRANYTERFDIRLVMGGLRPGGRGATDGVTRPEKLAEPITPAKARIIRHHWRDVAKMTRQKFDEAFFERTDFIYDTEPAAKAVVVMEKLAPQNAYAYYHHIQTAFYSQNQDITSPETLATLAAEYGVQTAEFLRYYESEAAHKETWGQFEFSAHLGIRGFPALVMEREREYYLITRGWQPFRDIQAVIEHVLKTAAPGATTASGENCEVGNEC